MVLNHANCGSERHDSWFGAVAFTRTTLGSLGSQYSAEHPARWHLGGGIDRRHVAGESANSAEPM